MVYTNCYWEVWHRLVYFRNASDEFLNDIFARKKILSSEETVYASCYYNSGRSKNKHWRLHDMSYMFEKHVEFSYCGRDFRSIFGLVL